ncbi:hypothetical protein NDU88_001047 [Pleurodeles waltl]|uniref:Uncharacterized protein n=1 Tax=Pleurodeles waltl TaxID=8319 RepID=A0AAV7P4L7_PLEWA|nr:hypothetical protein NDU88_001047 [Pleurodeles waltl]
MASSGSQIIEESSLFLSWQAPKQDRNPHTDDFESLIRSLAKEHDYKTSASTTKSKGREESDSSSSAHSSDQGDNPPRKHKKKTHHPEKPVITTKVLTFEPEDIVHPRSTLWLSPAEDAEYVESQIRHGFSPGYVLNAQDQISPPK